MSTPTPMAVALGLLAVAAAACAHADTLPSSGDGGSGGDDSVTSAGGAGSTSRSAAMSGTSSTAAGPACLPGFSSCDGVCIDTTSDPSNCGHCSDACAAGATCVHGTCAISCDFTGNCGQCLDCSGSAGVCQVEVEKCLVNSECKAIVTCMYGCGDDACSNGCFSQHPNGEAVWKAAFQCAHCNACPSDCQVTNCP